MSESSSAAAKAATAGKNLRGEKSKDRSDSALSSLGSFAEMQDALSNMRTLEALQTKREKMNPVEGFFYDPWVELIGGPDSPDRGEPRSFEEAFQAPYERRVERAGGAPFEGPVDWNGIAAAIFGGQSSEERDAAMRLARNPQKADPSRYSPNPNGTEWMTFGMFDDYVNSEAFGKPQIDPESGFIRDPQTGTYYREDLLPPSDTRLAQQPPGIQLPSFAPLEGLAAGMQAEGARWNSAEAGLPPMPRPRPSYAPQGIDAMAVPLPGQTEGGPPIEIEVRGGNGIESDEARYAREHPVEEPKKKTLLDSVVEGAGGLLGNTALGGAVKALFPDLWYGAGETIKSLDDGLTYGGGRSSGTNFEYLPQNGSLSEQVPGGEYGPPAPFPDLNHNGIDDRLEGFSPGVTWGSRTAQFPELPPYNPGRDNEWKYFTGPGYAEGGEVEGGEPELDSSQDPRMSLIADAEDVLEGIMAGEPPSEADAQILKAFVAQFGDDALRALNDQVKGGMKMRGPKGDGARMVEGPGGPTDDAIPAVIDGNQPAALSDGEVVIPADAVRAAGNGNREKGAKQLMALSDMLVGR